MSNARILVGLLTLSAAGYVAIATEEQYVERAMIPTQGDRPTLGLGSTFHADGSPVKLGDKTTPVRAMVTALAHISRDERLFRESLEGASLSQAEFDLYLNWVYQYGPLAWSASSMRREILAGNYEAACDALLLYRKAGGYDCSTMIDGKPNKRCWGVWTRQLERNQQCKAAQ